MSIDRPTTVQELYGQIMARTRPFVAHEVFDPRADAVTYFAKDVATNGEWLDPFVTLFFAAKDGELVGFKVKCVRTVVQRILEDRGGQIGPVTFDDVLVKAGELSDDAHKEKHRSHARGSELAERIIPEEAYR